MSSRDRGKRRTHATWTTALAGLALALSPLHCADTPDSGSQTHWLDACTADGDCGQGLTCACGLCTRSCDGADACTNLGRGAICSSGAAIGPQCSRVAGFKLCLPSCSEGCRRGERCSEGACVPATGARDAR